MMAIWINVIALKRIKNVLTKKHMPTIYFSAAIITVKSLSGFAEPGGTCL